MGTAKSRKKRKVAKASTSLNSTDIHRTLICSGCKTKRTFTSEELAEHQRTNHIQCICCQGLHDISCRTLSCTNGHSLCCSCTKHFVHSQLTSKVFPMSCSMCKVELQASDIYRLLKKKELQTYTDLAISRSLGPNEVLFSCRNDGCGATCILEQGDCAEGSLSTWIKCFECNVSTCATCLQTSRKAVKKHSKECAELAELKRAFESAIAEGAGSRCPKCKVSGRKDYGCNAIYCTQCQTNWCYVCGTAQERSHGCARHVHQVTTETMYREKTLALLRALHGKTDKALFRKLWHCFELRRTATAGRKWLVDSHLRDNVQSWCC